MNLVKSPVRIWILTLLAMLAFAGNSLLCRLAFQETSIDPVTFTTIRLISGALILWLIVLSRHSTDAGKGNTWSAIALFGYAAGFSFAYVNLTAATGALLLFGAVQFTMIGYGLATGERFSIMQWCGLLLALAGLTGLLMPGLSSPPVMGSLLMTGAGVAWAVYSLRGRAAGDPTRVTAGNFIRAVPFGLVLLALNLSNSSLDLGGMLYAVASGAVASGLGYAIWYTVLPFLAATHAATVQLSVPVLTAIGGWVLLGEPLTLRLMVASVAVLGGIALVILRGHHVVNKLK